MDLICFGQQNWDYCWTAKQQLTTRLVRRGHRVFYVDPDWEPAASRREWARALRPATTRFGLREIEPNLFVYTYKFVPPLGWRLNYRRHPRVVAALARQLGFHSPVALSLIPRRSLEMTAAVRPAARVYYPVDEWTAFGGYTEEEARGLRREEEALLREVDLALAVSPRLVRRLRLSQPRTWLLENAADVEHFSPERLLRVPGHPEVARLPRPRLGFVGQIDERLDQDLLVAMARQRPEWQIVLAGRVKPRVDVSALTAEPNIHLLGYQPYGDLPSVLREVDVCLVPYRLTELTQSCWPLKALEYLATGKPVVATPLESLLRLREHIALAATREEFLRAVEQALADPLHGREQRLAVAAENSWDRRVLELEQRLQEALAIARQRPRAASLSPSTVPGAGENENLRPTAKFRLLYAATRLAGWLYYGLRVAGRFISGKRPVAVRRILVARYGWLGDTIAILPMLAALRRRYPEARIVLGVQPGFSAGPIVEGLGSVDEIRVLKHLQPPAPPRQALAGTWRLFREGFDLVFSGTGFTVQRAAFLSGAPWLIGLDDGHPLQQLNTRLVPLDPVRHESENNLALVEWLAEEVELADRIPRIRVDTAATEAAFQRLADRLGFSDGRPIVTIHPGSKKPSRRWPAERFAELIEDLLAGDSNLQVVLSGGPAEVPLLDSIRSAVASQRRGRVFGAAGLTSLTGLIGLLDRSKVLVCNDTGVMHIARARGVSLVALLGPENDWRWGPYPAGEAPAVALRHAVPCAPCSRWSCDRLYCLHSLTVPEVAAQVRAVLDREITPDGMYGVERYMARHSWADLAAAGHELPLVSVILDASNDFGVESPVAAIARQDYPNLEIILVRRSVDAVRNFDSSPIRLRSVSLPASGAYRDGLAAILNAARGELLIGFDRHGPWPAGRLSAEVARAIRDSEHSGHTIGPNLPRSADAICGTPLGRAVWRSALQTTPETEATERTRPSPASVACVDSVPTS